MWIYICGDNERTYYLREMANKRGHRVTCPDDAQVIVLPLPRSEVSPALSERLHRGQILVCGLVNDELRRKAQAAEWTLHCLYEDEKYQQENAVDSAEGAVFALMREAPFLISGSRCLVIGAEDWAVHCIVFCAEWTPKHGLQHEVKNSVRESERMQ